MPRKSRRSRKALSEILAVLLAVVVSVALGLVLYTWASGLFTSTSAILAVNLEWNPMIYGQTGVPTNWNVCASGCHDDANYQTWIVDDPPQTCGSCHTDVTAANTYEGNASRYLEAYQPKDSKYGTYDSYAGFGTPGWRPSHGVTGLTCPQCHIVHTPSVSFDGAVTGLTSPDDECQTCHNHTFYIGQDPAGHGSYGNIMPHATINASAAALTDGTCASCHGYRHGGSLPTVTIVISNTGTVDANITAVSVDGTGYDYIVIEGDISDGISPGEVVRIVPVSYDSYSLIYPVYTSGKTVTVVVTTEAGTSAAGSGIAP